MAETKTNALPANRPTDAIKHLLAAKAPDLREVLQHTPVRWESFRNAVVASAARNPKLVEAMAQSPDTFYLAVNRAAELGLVPGDVHGHCYMIPRKNRHRDNRLEVNFQIGYKGLIDLAYRHPRVKAVEMHLVYDGEDFNYDRGNSQIHHPYSWGTDRRPEKVIGGYALARVEGLELPVAWILDRQEIEERRARSQAADNGPWVTDWKAMALKTCVRALLGSGRVPLSTEAAEVIRDEIEEEIKPAKAVVRDEEPTAASAVEALKNELGMSENGESVAEEPERAEEEAESDELPIGDLHEGKEAPATAARGDIWIKPHGKGQRIYQFDDEDETWRAANDGVRKQVLEEMARS